MRPDSGSCIATNQSKIEKTMMTSQFGNMTSSTNFLMSMYLLSSLDSGLSYTSVSCLVLVLVEYY